jgi:hypothetical protein
MVNPLLVHIKSMDRMTQKAIIMYRMNVCWLVVLSFTRNENDRLRQIIDFVIVYRTRITNKS